MLARISKTDKGFYKVYLESMLVGFMKKDPEVGFKFKPKSGIKHFCKIDSKTAKGVKEYILDVAKIFGIKPPVKPKLITLDQVRRRCALSHNGIKTFLREIDEFHPKMRRHLFGSYIMRRSMQNAAGFEGEKGQARKWLGENKKVGLFETFYPDPDHLEVKIEVQHNFS